MNTAIFFANVNSCVMSGMYGTDRIHVDPFKTGRRCVPFRVEKRMPPCTRAHALRWQITPRWGCRIRNCGRIVCASRPSMGPIQGRKTAVPANQGLQHSLADYASLGMRGGGGRLVGNASESLGLCLLLPDWLTNIWRAAVAFRVGTCVYEQN